MSDVKKITLKVPPDQTPEEEARLVAEVAAAIMASGTDAETLEFELHKPEEADFGAVSQRTQASSRWNG